MYISVQTGHMFLGLGMAHQDERRRRSEKTLLCHILGTQGVCLRSYAGLGAAQGSQGELKISDGVVWLHWNARAEIASRLLMLSDGQTEDVVPNRGFIPTLWDRRGDFISPLHWSACNKHNVCRFIDHFILRLAWSWSIGSCLDQHSTAFASYAVILFALTVLRFAVPIERLLFACFRARRELADDESPSWESLITGAYKNLLGVVPPTNSSAQSSIYFA